MGKNFGQPASCFPRITLVRDLDFSLPLEWVFGPGGRVRVGVDKCPINYLILPPTKGGGVEDSLFGEYSRVSASALVRWPSHAAPAQQRHSHGHGYRIGQARRPVRGRGGGGGGRLGAEKNAGHHQ